MLYGSRTVRGDEIIHPAMIVVVVPARQLTSSQPTIPTGTKESWIWLLLLVRKQQMWPVGDVVFPISSRVYAIDFNQVTIGHHPPHTCLCENKRFTELKFISQIRGTAAQQPWSVPSPWNGFCGVAVVWGRSLCRDDFGEISKFVKFD